jgi:hypothetical protein
MARPSNLHKLMQSIVGGQLDKLDELLTFRKVRVDEVTSGDRYPLHCALVNYFVHVRMHSPETWVRSQIVLRLLMHGADPDHALESGETLLDYARNSASGLNFLVPKEQARITRIVQNLEKHSLGHQATLGVESELPPPPSSPAPSPVVRRCSM